MNLISDVRCRLASSLTDQGKFRINLSTVQLIEIKKVPKFNLQRTLMFIQLIPILDTWKIETQATHFSVKKGNFDHALFAFSRRTCNLRD